MIEIISYDVFVQDKIQEIADQNGPETVQNLIIEESGELLKAIGKYRRYKGLEGQRRWLENIAEETVDLLLVCLQNAYLLDRKAGIDMDQILVRKISRTTKELGIE